VRRWKSNELRYRVLEAFGDGDGDGDGLISMLVVSTILVGAERLSINDGIERVIG
jgi:hypothetical protein